MTASRRHTFSFRQTGFTLIELLVTVGIIVLIMSLLTPVVMMKAKKQAQVRTKLTADFATIGQGLEAYKADFHDYPRGPDTPNTGFAVLGKAMCSACTATAFCHQATLRTAPNDPNDPPSYVASGQVYKAGDAVQASGIRYVAMVENAQPVSNTNSWVQFNANDLLDGLGTRLRLGGRTAGPYLQIERFRVRGCAIVDSNDFPILYFPAVQTKPNLTVALQSGGPSFIGLNGYGIVAGVNQNLSLFNVNDNLFFFMRPLDQPLPDLDPTRATARFAAMLGDADNDGLITGGEQAASTGPYLLWAPGPDGFYGPKTAPGTVPGPSDTPKCDDVTNFSK